MTPTYPAIAPKSRRRSRTSPGSRCSSDAVLQELVREALANNRDLLAAASRVEQARGLAAVARSELFPEIGYDGDAARGKDTSFGAPGAGPRHRERLPRRAERRLGDRHLGPDPARERGRARGDARDRGVPARRGAVAGVGVAQAYFELRELDLELEIAHRTVECVRRDVRPLRARSSRAAWRRSSTRCARRRRSRRPPRRCPTSSGASSPRRTSSPCCSAVPPRRSRAAARSSTSSCPRRFQRAFPRSCSSAGPT